MKNSLSILRSYEDNWAETAKDLPRREFDAAYWELCGKLDSGEIVALRVTNY